MTEPAAGLDPARLDMLWDLQDPTGSERRLRDAITLSLAAGSATETAELTTQLARALGLQDRFSDADALLDSVEPDHLPAVVGIRQLLERGRLRNSAGDPTAASPLFRSAWERAQATGADFLAADAAHMLAISDPERAEEWTVRGLDVVHRSTDPRCARWAGPLHHNLAWTLREAGDLPRAVTEFEAALAAYTAGGTAEQIRIARQSLDECRQLTATQVPPSRHPPAQKRR